MEPRYETTLPERLKNKEPLKQLIDEAIANPALLNEYITIVNQEKGSIKFGASKVIIAISEIEPRLVYPYFQKIARMLECPNSFIKWGAVIALSNLVAVDDDKLFLAIFERYFHLLDDEKMVSAANVAGNAWKIVSAYPGLEPEITKRLLLTINQTYYHQGHPSPECHNVLAGHLIECFDRYFDQAANQKAIIEFVTGQLDNPRNKVARLARAFVKKHHLGAI